MTKFEFTNQFRMTNVQMRKEATFRHSDIREFDIDS